MASTLPLPSRPSNNLSSPQLKWGAITTGTVQTSTHLYRQLSDIVLKPSQNDFSSVSTSGSDQDSMGSRCHLSVETSENNSTASDCGSPRIVIKFRLQSKNKTNVDAVAHVAAKTLVSANVDESARDQTTTASKGVKDPSKLTEGHTLVSTEANIQSPVQKESTQLGFVPKEKENKKNKRLFSTFSVSLTRYQIVADLQAINGSKRIKRVKKRPKTVQKQLDNLFPGLRLKHITPDDYKVLDHNT